MKLQVDISGTGPDLVLLHGWGMNPLVWGGFSQSLAQRYRLHLVSLPGHGGSAFDPAASSLNDWSAAVLNAVPAGAIWLGWSLGALVAIDAALQAPDAIDGLLLFSATPKFVQGERWDCAVPAAVFDEFKSSLQQNSHRTLMRFLALQVQQDESAKALLARLRDQMKAMPEPAPAALAVGLDILQNTDLRGQLSGLQCRCHWLLGQRDTLVPRCVQAELQKLDPVTVVTMIPGAAHAPMLSHPEQCLRRVEEFLRT